MLPFQQHFNFYYRWLCCGCNSVQRYAAQVCWAAGISPGGVAVPGWSLDVMECSQACVTRRERVSVTVTCHRRRTCVMLASIIG